MPNKFRYPTSGSSTRPVAAYLTATKTIGAGSLTVNVATGWPTGDIDILVFRRTSTSTAERPVPVTGTITSWQGNNSAGTVGSLVLRAGTDQEYAAGELSVVMVAPTAAWGKDLIDGLAASHNIADGTMIASLPLTTPKITTSINDANGNEVIKTPATSSAVNEFTITNAATGNSPTLSATGGDTNIDINLTPKGSGKVKIGGNPVLTRLGTNTKTTTATVLTTTYTTYCTVTATSSGKECEVDFRFFADNAVSVSDRIVYAKVQCDGVDVTPIDLNVFLHNVPGLAPAKCVSFVVSSTPTADEHTWTLQIKASANTAVDLNQAVMRVCEVV